MQTLQGQPAPFHRAVRGALGVGPWSWCFPVLPGVSRRQAASAALAPFPGAPATALLRSTVPQHVPLWFAAFWPQNGAAEATAASSENPELKRAPARAVSLGIGAGRCVPARSPPWQPACSPPPSPAAGAQVASCGFRGHCPNDGNKHRFFFKLLLLLLFSCFSGSFLSSSCFSFSGFSLRCLSGEEQLSGKRKVSPVPRSRPGARQRAAALPCPFLAGFCAFCSSSGSDLPRASPPPPPGHVQYAQHPQNWPSKAQEQPCNVQAWGADAGDRLAVAVGTGPALRRRDERCSLPAFDALCPRSAGGAQGRRTGSSCRDRVR
ncbi:uncharacterized protein [Struthio camelus]|uniref:uncharacterized protein n=1 Tax=Struthio camelus TaxID=8801 RepID=UPI0036040AB5